MIVGSLFGFFKGIVLMSLIFVMFVFLPNFRNVNDSIDKSVLARNFRQVVPFICRATTPLHPNGGTFADKVSHGILGDKAKSYARRPESLLHKKGSPVLGMSDQDVNVIDNIDKYFGKNLEIAKKDK